MVGQLTKILERRVAVALRNQEHSDRLQEARWKETKARLEALDRLVNGEVRRSFDPDHKALGLVDIVEYLLKEVGLKVEWVVEDSPFPLPQVTVHKIVRLNK